MSMIFYVSTTYADGGLVSRVNGSLACCRYCYIFETLLLISIFILFSNLVINELTLTATQRRQNRYSSDNQT